MGSRGSGFTVPGIEEMAKLKGSTDFGNPLGIVGKGYQGGVNRHVYKIVFGSELGPDKNRPVAYLPVHVRLAPSTIHYTERQAVEPMATAFRGAVVDVEHVPQTEKPESIGCGEGGGDRRCGSHRLNCRIHGCGSLSLFLAFSASLQMFGNARICPQEGEGGLRRPDRICDRCGNLGLWSWELEQGYRIHVAVYIT